MTPTSYSTEKDRTLAWVACCVWECFIEEEAPWTAWRAENGAIALREVACDLAVTAEHVWISLTNTERDDGPFFDWEWIPMWLRMCVDWSDLTQHPKVKP